jgi:predicted transcriptional regulator
MEEDGWQIEVMEEGVRRADAGEFASDEEVQDAFRRWGVGDDTTAPTNRPVLG